MGHGRAQIVGLLRERQARVRLQRAVGSEHWLAFVSNWSELDACLHSLPVAVAVIDPRGRSGVQVEAVERLTAHHPSLSVLLYLPFGPEIAGPLLRWARLGVHHVAFLDLGDSTWYLRELVNRALARSAAEAVADAVVAALAPRRARLAEVFRTGVRRLNDIRTASDWALAVGIPTSSLYRLFREEGFLPPKRSLDWLRLLVAAKWLADPGYTPEDVRRRLRASVPATFWGRVPALTGASLSELRYTMPVERLVQRFAEECRSASQEARAPLRAAE